VVAVWYEKCLLIRDDISDDNADDSRATRQPRLQVGKAAIVPGRGRCI
jgi:hypothetical protein